MSSTDRAKLREQKLRAVDEKVQEDIVWYNEEGIHLIPEKYRNLLPLGGILVRVFLKELQKTESGLYMPNTIAVEIKTDARMGNYAEVDSPFPYSNRVLIVATSRHYQDTIPEGSVGVLVEAPITAAMGTGKMAQLAIPDGFLHPEEIGKYDGAPEDIRDPNYGFLFIKNPSKIVFIERNSLKNVEEE